MLFVQYKNNFYHVNLTQTLSCYVIQGTFKCPFNQSKVSECGNCTVFAHWMCLKVIVHDKNYISTTSTSFKHCGGVRGHIEDIQEFFQPLQSA